jgi:hypothetical protein
MDARYDRAGNLHVLSVRDERCFYKTRSAAEEKFGPERPVPSEGPVQCGGERRPRIMVDRKGRIFAIWPVSGGLHLVRSDDRGESWSPLSTADLIRRSGADVFNATLSDDGILYLVWIGEHDAPLADDRFAQHVYLATSSNGGDTFTPPRTLTTDSARACPCCVPAIATSEAGLVWIAFRSSIANVKETVLLASEDRGKSFAARQVSSDGWVMVGCPMTGPSLAAAGSQVILSWTSEKDMYTAASADGGKSFSSPRRLGRGRFHQVAASSDGRILQAWDEGTQTGLWWRDQDGPAPRADITPRGILLGAPDGHFELLD